MPARREFEEGISHKRAMRSVSRGTNIISAVDPTGRHAVPFARRRGVAERKRPGKTGPRRRMR